jgi:hypothetical protein
MFLNIATSFSRNESWLGFLGTAICAMLFFATTTNAAHSSDRKLQFGSSWEVAKFCAENVQSPKKFDTFFDTSEDDSILTPTVEASLNLLELNQVFGKFFKIRRNSIRVWRSKEVVYEKGKKTDRTVEFFTIWGRAQIVNDVASRPAKFCLVSKSEDVWFDLKGILLPNSFSRHLTTLASHQPNPFNHSTPSIRGNWMLAVYSAEFKNRLKRVQP